MYLRADHAELDVPLLQDFIRSNPLGILITSLPSSNFPTIQTSHIPFLLDVPEPASSSSSSEDLGVLRGHMARQNPHAKALAEAIQGDDTPEAWLEHEVCVLFNGPVHAYVTPKFYKEVKPATGRVVPTWNYSAAQVYGKARLYVDAHAEDTINYLKKQVSDLTNYAENSVMERMGGDSSTTWKVTDAPGAYIDLLRKNIIGVEIRVERLEGKFKMSQERPVGDRDGVVEGFEALESDLGTEMATMVESRAALKEARSAARAGST